MSNIDIAGPIQLRDPLVRKKEHALRIRSLCYSKNHGVNMTIIVILQLISDDCTSREWCADRYGS